MNTMDLRKLSYLNEIGASSVATSSNSAQDSSSGSISSTSDVTSASSLSSSNFIDFSNRRAEARDARLANSILSLDEDIPEDIDDSIKTLLKNHITTTMKVDDHYLEYKQQMATKRYNEKKLPTSKARSARQKSSAPQIDHTTAS
jgi:hypothetical protein